MKRDCGQHFACFEMPNELLTYSRLLDIVARTFGHDWLLLMSGAWSLSGKEKWCKAVFGQYADYGTATLEADGRQVLVKSVDAEGHHKSNEDMYHELVELVYKTLENGGQLSDGRCAVDASMVPEFMVECALNGIGCLENREEMRAV